MTSLGNGEPITYRVIMSGQVQDQIKQLHFQAALSGKGQAVLSAFRQMITRLKNEPQTFGEPLYRLPAAKLQVRLAVVAPLVVDYGLYQEKPLVFIRGFKVLS